MGTGQPAQIRELEVGEAENENGNESGWNFGHVFMMCVGAGGLASAVYYLLLSGFAIRDPAERPQYQQTGPAPAVKETPASGPVASPGHAIPQAGTSPK